MKRNYKDINNIEELRVRIQLLKADYTGREILLKEDSRNYINQFTILNLFKKFTSPEGFSKLDGTTNISGKIMSLVLPLILNNTLFRSSGFITKAVGAFVSGKIGKSIDVESVSGIFHTIKSLFASKKKDKQKLEYVDYGIPPDSETS